MMGESGNSSGASAVSPSDSLQPESLEEMDRLVSSSRNLLKTMETSQHEKALSLQLPLQCLHAPGRLPDPTARAHPDGSCPGPPCVSSDGSKSPICIIFKPLFFLRLASGRRKGHVFIDLLDIWGLGISLGSVENLAFYGILSLLDPQAYADSRLLFFM